ncbi:class II aldolase/adducin family protein [Temperatibacter marinus]|uniref:Class II aldolase/adducin family protein n=1 Tax=Temperatibacter marinus TaxID=1456591 RepID=A0AA52H871_9PROT|nr:class II aldolase/adducin family protein [Temperatibacter marinus]WND01821.1 class II aldolase/adducin family protein [Temperatibacter marinus]
MTHPYELEIPCVKDQVSAEEWKIRCDLAAAYRLVADFGWDDLIYTHLSARVPGSDHHFLMNPLGLMFDEITASSLVKIDLSGEKVMDSPFEVNRAGFVIHSAIHEAREDAHCIVHLHTDYGIAVSNLKEGLLPLAQSSLVPYAFMSYHDYHGFAVNDEERESLVKDLGEAKAMILRNHGTLTAAPTVAAAFELMFFLEKACRIQILTQSAGAEIQGMSQEALQQALKDMYVVLKGDTTGSMVWPALYRRAHRLDPDFAT